MLVPQNLCVWNLKLPMLVPVWGGWRLGCQQGCELSNTEWWLWPSHDDPLEVPSQSASALPKNTTGTAVYCLGCRQPRWLSGLMRSRVHSLWLLVDHCVLRNWDRILVRAVKGLISRAGMVSICPLLWQRDVKLQQTNKLPGLSPLCGPISYLIIQGWIISWCLAQVMLEESTGLSMWIPRCIFMKRYTSVHVIGSGSFCLCGWLLVV